MIKYDIYLRGSKFRSGVWASSPTHALNQARTALGGDPLNARLVCVTTYPKGINHNDAIELSKGLDCVDR